MLDSLPAHGGHGEAVAAAVGAGCRDVLLHPGATRRARPGPSGRHRTGKSLPPCHPGGRQPHRGGRGCRTGRRSPTRPPAAPWTPTRPNRSPPPWMENSRWRAEAAGWTRGRRSPERRTAVAADLCRGPSHRPERGHCHERSGACQTSGFDRCEPGRLRESSAVLVDVRRGGSASGTPPAPFPAVQHPRVDQPPDRASPPARPAPRRECTDERIEVTLQNPQVSPRPVGLQLDAAQPRADPLTGRALQGRLALPVNHPREALRNFAQ